MPGRRIPKIILSKNPNKKITEVKEGDLLLTFDEKTKELVETTVTSTLSREVKKWIRLTIKGTQYFLTEEHPFFTTRGLVEAKDLLVGDMVLHSSFNDKLSFRIKKYNPMFLQEARRKVSDFQKVKLVSEETRRKSSESNTGKVRSEEIKKKLSEGRKGEKNPNWKGGKSVNKNKLRTKITQREITACGSCKKTKVPLDIHHKDKNPMNDRIENLIVLCESCHYSIHQIGYNFWKTSRTDGKVLSIQNGFKVEAIKKFDFTSKKHNPVKFYNLTCSPYNSYLADYMWVHNCDTPYAQPLNSGKDMSIKEIISEVKTKNVTITGGEPLLQKDDLFYLIQALLNKNKNISIETSGVYPIIIGYPEVSWVMDW
ncbi:MAG: polymorphic toxin-type HINT domain-containing protein, partial [Nanoarchaeota archaeon]